MPLKGEANIDTWAHACGTFLGGTNLENAGACWWCGTDIHRAVPLTDLMRAARVLGGQEAVRVILRTMADIADHVPIEHDLIVTINGVEIIANIAVPPDRIVIITQPIRVT